MSMTIIPRAGESPGPAALPRDLLSATRTRAQLVAYCVNYH